jgi:hypothetical protein
LMELEDIMLSEASQVQKEIGVPQIITEWLLYAWPMNTKWHCGCYPPFPFHTLGNWGSERAGGSHIVMSHGDSLDTWNTLRPLIQSSLQLAQFLVNPLLFLGAQIKSLEPESRKTETRVLKLWNIPHLFLHP